MVHGARVDHPNNDSDSDEAPTPTPRPKKPKKVKVSSSAAPPKASRVKPLATAPPEASVQSEDLSRISKSDKMKKPMQPTGQALTPAAVLRNKNDAIDLSSDDDLGDDALEQLIKSKQEVEIFNDLPLFDVDILYKFTDEWFDIPDLSFDDLKLPIGLSVSFHGAIAPELALA